MCGRSTPREAVEGLEGGCPAGFPSSAWRGAVPWSREALEALPLSASGEQSGSLPLGGFCSSSVNALLHSQVLS